MSRTVRGALILVAGCAGAALAATIGSASASAPADPTTTTLGSTTGTPNQNICVATINCTYVPFSSAARAGLQVPFDGTVTSFSVNSGSATGAVELRVLRPAGNGAFTGAGTSPPENLAGGPQTFTVSLPVKAGDVLALDNSTSALLFDGTSADPAFTAYYQPALADGSTSVPNVNRTDRRLLLSAIVRSSGATTTATGTTTATTNTGTNGTVTVTTTIIRSAPARPVIGNLTQSNSVWRLGSRLASFSRRQRPPVGTTFAFGLSTASRVTFAFRQRGVLKGTLSFAGHPGTDRLRFQGRLAGRKLKKGRYTATVTATNIAGTSSPVSIAFTIAS